MVSGNQNPEKMMNSSRGFETRTWCMCHCISVIIYSDTLMLTALARGPFTLCAFNFVRTIFCVMPLHFWRDCVTGLPYTLPVVFMTSCYCKFWHINEAQTCRTPERRVLLLYSWQTAMHQGNDATWRDAVRCKVMNKSLWLPNLPLCSNLPCSLQPIPREGNTCAHTDTHLDIQERW